MPKPLQGIRVADFSHVMAGPFASHFLCLLGAEVIKIEPPGRGDAFRNYGSDRRYDGMAPAFIAANAGKKSIALNLKEPEGVEAARRLIATCDVVLENFRPGVMDRLGLGYEACRALRPEIIFCSVSGYGQSGPLRDYPAIDNIVQATSGMMSLGGDPGGPPLKVGFPAIDTWTGQTGAVAILAALLQRERFGGGQYIDLAMLDAALVFMASAATPYLVTGKPFERTGNTGYSGLPTAGMFRTREGGVVSLGVVQPVQFERLCRVIGRPDLLQDPRFASPDLQRENSAALQAILEAVFIERDGFEWEKALSSAGVPCGLVREVPQVFEQLDHLKDRQLLFPVRAPGLPDREEIEVLGTGFMFAHDGPGVDQPPPRLGQHTAEVLRQLGYSDAEVRELQQAGVAATDVPA
jgi:crotonobetainyl-CoA:carnitine CoA-transferase CaiB-like acyl-CoA transferase